MTSIEHHRPALRGRVIRAEPGLPAWTNALPADTRATRLTYYSTSGIDGSSTIVTGAVFVRTFGRPSGGWPLIAYAHGTTGITRDCAPSDSDTMAGDINAIRGRLLAGYAVVTTDYQGLGVRIEGSAPHPYLEPRTAAFNLVDAVRAARSIEPTIGSRWLAVGTSQGGAAAWATAENYHSYGSGSGDLLGAVALSPLLDASYFVDLAQRGELDTDQRMLYPMVVSGLAQSARAVRPGNYLHGIVRDVRNSLISCTPNRHELIFAIAGADAGQFVASAPAAALLTMAIRNYALPHERTAIPILSMYGSVDSIIPPSVIEGALARACTIGDKIMRVRLDGQGHSLAPGVAMETWMDDRVARRPAVSDC